MLTRLNWKLLRVLLFVAWPIGLLGMSGQTLALTPPPTTAHFAVVSDYGSAGQDELDVSNLIRSWNPDFIATSGDNNYPDGEASTIDANVGQYYHDFIYPYLGSYGQGATTNKFFPMMGNHDWTLDTDPQAYLDYFTLPNNERYYDYTWGPVHIFVLDSNAAEPDGITSTSVQAQWLQTRLAAATEPWKIVMDHHPPYSSGLHGSTPELQWPFQQWGASIVLSAHDHSYERLLINGFPYIVAGLGGRSIYDQNPPIPGSVVQYNGDFGAMLVDADASQITFRFFARTGTLVDSYTINAPEPTPTGTPPTATLTRTRTPTISPTPTRTPTILPGLSWEAEAGDIASPFVINGGVVSQTINTIDPTFGGRAAYRFNITTPGSYVVKSLLNGPSFLSSAFLNMDAEPVDSTMAWDAPDTNGTFQQVTARWRGVSTPEDPKVFNLSAGEHMLIIRGRERDLLFDQVSVEPYPVGTSTATPVFTGTPTWTATRTNTPATTVTTGPTVIAMLVGHVTWQGRPAQPDPLQQLPITLTLRSGAPDFNYPVQNTDNRGFFTVTTNIPAGAYNWRVKGPKFLANAGSMTLAAGSNPVEMGLMLTGDANNDNIVSAVDYTTLRVSFGKGIGDPGYDDRADFNGDNRVNTVDFTLLKTNFGRGGAP